MTAEKEQFRRQYKGSPCKQVIPHCFIKASTAEASTADVRCSLFERVKEPLYVISESYFLSKMLYHFREATWESEPQKLDFRQQSEKIRFLKIVTTACGGLAMTQTGFYTEESHVPELRRTPKGVAARSGARPALQPMRFRTGKERPQTEATRSAASTSEENEKERRKRK